MNNKLKLKNSELEKVQYDPFREGIFDHIAPSSEAQREIWTSIKFEEDATLCYNETIELVLNGIINEQILEYAFYEVARRHDSLRCNFSHDGQTILVKNEPGKIFSKKDLTKSFNADEEFEEYKNKVQKTPMKIEKDALFSSVLFKFSESSYKLIIVSHHIICDGWSYAIILSELSTIYSALVSSETPILNEPVSFSDYSLNHNDNNEQKESSLKYWKNELASFQKNSSFASDFPRTNYRTFNSKRIDYVLNSNQVLNFKKLCSKNGVSLYTGLISIFGILLSRITNSNDQIIGLSSATQPTLENNNLVGHLVNLLPYRFRLDPNSNFLGTIKSNKGPMLDAFEHQFITFGELVSLLKIPRVPGEMPLINIVFNIDQQLEDQGINFKNAKSIFKSVPRVYENFEIFINAVSRGNYLELECQYNEKLFSAETIENWLKAFEEILELVLFSPETKVSDIVLNNLRIPSIKNVQNNITKQVINDNKFNPSEVSNILLNVWKKLLINEDISFEDNFFSLGGHSLLAIDMINILREEYNYELKMKDIFECPTIKELSPRAKKVANSLQSQVENIETAVARPTETKLSNALMQIWYLEELNPKTQMHNLPAAILIDELIDPIRFRKAFLKLIERHEAFRTVVVKNKGKVLQKILSYSDISSVFDLPIEKNVPESVISEKLASEANYVFQKDKFPLFKIKLFYTDNNKTVMFFMVHHAIWDGWSFDIFFEELNVLYKDENIKLPTIGMTYLEYTDFINKKIDNGSMADSSEYWKNKLIPELPILNIPTDFKRPKDLSHVGKSIYFDLSNDLVQKLKTIAARSNSSLFNLFLTAYKISLLAFSKESIEEEEIVVGMPIRARANNEVLNTIGFFVNTLAIRSKIDFSKSFSQNLKLVSETVLDATEHQLYPFQLVLNEINYDRNSGRNPVFQSFFSYQDVSNRNNEFNNKKYKQVNVDKNSVHTEIDLWIKSSEIKTEGAFEYDVQLFEFDTINNIKKYFVNLLELLASCEEIDVLNNIPMAKDMQEYLVNTINQTFEKIDERPFFYLIDEQAQKNPHKIAIYNQEGSLSYSELKSKSDALASYIISTNLGNENLIGISLKRSPEMLIAILAVLKANKGYVPLDPNFPSDRIEYMISNSKIKTIITEENLKSKYLDGNNIILLDTFDFSKSGKNEFAKVSHNQTAYVIYTSGSTGLPKGVEISHLSVSNFLAGMNKFSVCNLNDKLLAVTTISFDIAVLEMYLPLINGASIYLASSHEVVDGQQLKTIIENENITAMQATPTTWRLLLQSGFKGKSDLTILCGGESFPIDLAHKLIPIVKKVLNMYGPTETTVWSSVKELKLTDSNITIGKPILNTSFYILNDSLKLVPQGAIGQIFIGGIGLAKGYLNRNDLTEEKFIRNPYRPDELIYATGDLGRINSHGDIVCLGRNDGQVKVRGFRIELGEIEALVQKIPNIKECTSIVHDFGNGDKRIILYYSTINGEKLSDELFKSNLTKNIPGYMIPSFFEFMNHIPKTNNGKIDKKALPKDKFKGIRAESSSSKKVIIPTVTKNNDGVIDRIWKDILRNENITDSDNFFDLGGNSLLAVEMMALISEKLDIDIQLSVLLESKNLEDFKNSVLEKSTPSVNKNERSELVPHLNKVFQSLVTIKTQGELNPIFCFHGVGGNVLNYISLLPALKKQRSLFAFQSIGLDGESEPLLSIEEMALHYYRELKLVKPDGPYILAGGSMGGLIALEVARRLQAAGDEVEMLVMFDTFGPNFELSSYSSNRKVSFIGRIVKGVFRRIKLKINLAQVYIRRNLGLKIPIKPLLVEIEHKNYQAIWKYKPGPYKGDMILIRSNLEKTGWYSDKDLGWKGIIEGNIEKYYIDGKHESFIENPELIKVLNKILK